MLQKSTIKKTKIPCSPASCDIHCLFIYLLLFFLMRILNQMRMFDWLIDWLIDFGCVGSSFLCEGFLQLWQAGASLHRDARASLVAEHRLQTRRLSSCGSRAQPLRGMGDLPRPGLEPVSPALAGRFSTTAPPGKPSTVYFLMTILHVFWQTLLRPLMKRVDIYLGWF